MNDIEYGKFYILNEAISLTELASRNTIKAFTFINFESETSIKIIPFYNKINEKERNRLINFYADRGIDLRLDDALGKLHIVVLKILLDETNEHIVIINNVGLTDTSINFLQMNLNILQREFKDKSVIVCHGRTD